ncbi:MAG: 50S ribosomal protein L4 [bacterium]|nr:MAG: 50S ribosomal protein L4 [bacterium]
MKIKTYTLKGKDTKELVLPKIYGVEVTESLLKQAIRVYEDGTHFGLSRVKTRSEINATRKKLYKQKGTGGARHGAKSAHIFVGGGVAHGPKGVKRQLKLSEKMKKLALTMALSKRFKAGDFVVVNGVNKFLKTNGVSEMVDKIKKDFSVKSKVVFVISKENQSFSRFLKNIKDLEVVQFSSLNAFKVLTSQLIIFDSQCFEKEKSKK